MGRWCQRRASKVEVAAAWNLQQLVWTACCSCILQLCWYTDVPMVSYTYIPYIHIYTDHWLIVIVYHVAVYYHVILHCSVFCILWSFCWLLLVHTPISADNTRLAGSGSVMRRAATSGSVTNGSSELEGGGTAGGTLPKKGLKDTERSRKCFLV